MKDVINASDAVFQSVVESLFQGHFKNIMARMHQCAATCYSGNRSSSSADDCSSNCQVPAQNSRQVAEVCLNNYRSVLSNCLTAGIDSTRYKKLTDAETENELQVISDRCFREFSKLQSKVVEDCLEKLNKIPK